MLQRPCCGDPRGSGWLVVARATGIVLLVGLPLLLQGDLVVWHCAAHVVLDLHPAAAAVSPCAQGQDFV